MKLIKYFGIVLLLLFSLMNIYSIEANSNLLQYLKLDYNASDSWGSIDGTNNGVSFNGTAGTFDAAANDYIDLNFATTSDFTFNVWVKAANLAATWQGIFSSVDNSNQDGLSLRYYDDTPQLYFYVCSANVCDSNGISGVFAHSTWTMITVSKNGNTYKVYQDGTNIFNVTSSKLTANDNNIILGRYSADVAVNEWDDKMKLWSYWDTTLSQTNITDLYNNGITLPSAATPQIQLNISNGAAYNNYPLGISMTTTSNVNMSVYVNGVLNQTFTDTNSSTISLYLPEQYNNLSFKSEDGSGVNWNNITIINDYTAPNITVIGPITQDFEVNFSTIFNVTDALSGLASCTINITYLENITNASQYDKFVNCTDTTQFQAAGLYNGFVEAIDNAGNIATLSINGTIQPFVYVNFFMVNGSAITNYNATIYHPSGFIRYDLNTNNPVNISPVYNGSLDLGNYTVQFSKFGYITTNFTIPINETSGGKEYNFTITESNININIYDRTTGALLSGPLVEVTILELGAGNTTTGQISFQDFNFQVGTYSVQAISTGYYTEQKDFYYSGQANATVSLYLLEENLTTSSTLYVPVTDEWDNIISGSDTRLLEYDSSIFGFKEVSQCYTDTNGECRFLVEVGLKTYIVTTQKTINGILYTAQTSEEGEKFLPEISGGEEILGRDIIRNLKLQITDTIVTTDFYGLYITSPDTENDTIISTNSTSLTIEIPISFTATDNLDYTICLEGYRFTNSSMNSIMTPICTTGSSGIIPTSPISLNKDYNYQFWITAESGNDDKITYRKYYYYSSTSFFETLKNKHLVNPMIMFFWVILLSVALYLKSINIWVYGAWGLSVLQLAIFPGVLFASATVTIILINAGVLYMSKRTGDST